MIPEHQALACGLIAREAQYLDEQQWDSWLDLYTDDAILWIPTWRDEISLTDDPMTELSFMYLNGRAYLQERVHRIKSGRSIASSPLPRTAHLVAGSIAETQGDQIILVKSAWSSHVYMHKENVMHVYAGRYEHRLAWDDGVLRIEQKKIVLANDYLIGKLDFFYV